MKLPLSPPSVNKVLQDISSEKIALLFDTPPTQQGRYLHSGRASLPGHFRQRGANYQVIASYVFGAVWQDTTKIKQEGHVQP